jgi:hypothetical protein
MKKVTAFILYTIICGGVLAAVPKLSVLEYRKGKLAPFAGEYKMAEKGSFTKNSVNINFVQRDVKEIKEWTVSVENNSSKTVKLCFRLSASCGKPGGAFWDGFKIKPFIGKTFEPQTKRYIFPAVSYVKDRMLTGIGYAPMTLSSRFERRCIVANDKASLVFDSYMALEPGQKDKIYFISYDSKADDYTEFVEQIYLSYPKWFNVIDGADPRIFGMGGYFFSSEDNREYQLEEARRYGFDWEWYYNCYQKAGNHYPLPKFWDKSKGYKSEPGSLLGKCDRPGSIKDWIDYNKERITAGNKSAAMFFYYLQQYCNSDLIKKYYPDAIWIDKNGRAAGPSYGWAEEGAAQYAWFLHSKLGSDIRKQLAMIWRDFPIAGFALDCAIGDTRYYGKLLKNETGKAFDDKGKVFATEGIALAYNMDYTHKLPAKADGRKAASIINEFYTWLPMFYADAGIHEMTPFDRADLLAPRRLIAGQKPYYFWKGFRIDALLKWDELTPVEVREGLTGVVDHTILSSLRFGIIPAIFYLKGFYDIKALNPTLKKMVKSGWRAASYVKIEGRKSSPDPYAQEDDIWISRYGDDKESYIVLSAPDIKGTKGKARILTGKFGGGGAIYADLSGKPVKNLVKAEETIIDFDLKNREPLILTKVANLKSAESCELTASLSVKTPGKEQIAEFKTDRLKVADIMMSETGWQKQMGFENKLVFTKAPEFRFIPNDSFIKNISLVDKKKVEAVIVASPECVAENPDAVKLLEIYYDYYISRKYRPVHRLAVMTKYWNKDLRLPIVAPGDKKTVEAETVFIMGKKALKTLLPEDNFKDAIVGKNNGKQLLVGFFPGKTTNLELVTQLLNRLDESYPFIGGIKAKWALKFKLYGKTFKK